MKLSVFCTAMLASSAMALSIRAAKDQPTSTPITTRPADDPNQGRPETDPVSGKPIHFNRRRL
ncbi:uncharacterized protein PgNI_07379 [Pyricularia grisea]|uniref:Uncharacterized protein n=1 Tax=Pyricularia grisea TaxID=148305 RepID=A0A6P8B170_PYRGI|nr:uncharacterized protein PgNI_07379 [Pyricularia grisea]TLD08602.1 hypothetical protein PgNI_07379 [Pyricularia grisea]